MADKIISIRAPARGATKEGKYKGSSKEISIRAPARGATIEFIYGFLRPEISIRAPARGATTNSTAFSVKSLFQSALPRGERQMDVGGYLITGNFNPRSREGSDSLLNCTMTAMIFQSALPRGERQHNGRL